MASLHPAQWHRLRRLGAIAPSYQADLLLLPDLERFVPDVVLKRGRPLSDSPKVQTPGLGAPERAHQARHDGGLRGSVRRAPRSGRSVSSRIR